MWTFKAKTLTRRRVAIAMAASCGRRGGSHPTSEFRLCGIAGPSFPPARSCGCARRVCVTLRFRPQLRALNACRRISTIGCLSCLRTCVKNTTAWVRMRGGWGGRVSKPCLGRPWCATNHCVARTLGTCREVQAIQENKSLACIPRLWRQCR